MDSIKFHEKTVVGMTKREAKAEAALLAKEFRGDFCRAEAKAFLIPESLMVIKATP